ncbi:MAG: CHAT domain-containing protein, partial [Micromonosporaceae bacterium]|nr:CHAT domain-containing protein [Micromonosporaceae bacterium]
MVDEAADAPVAPRVFISYAHDSPEHRELVRAFWTLLRAQGVDAQLDAAQDQVGMDWALWAENEIQIADFVVVVGSPLYKLRAAGATGPDDGRGVFWEARLLRAMIFGDKASESMRKILPVVLPGRSPDDLPDFLAPSATHYFRVTELTEAGIADLLGAIFRTSAPLVPPLGSPRRPRVVTGLTLDVRVADGRIRTIAALGGGEPIAHEAAVPFGLFDAWRALSRVPLEANAELVSLGTRLFAALLPPDLQTTLPTVVQELPFDAHFPIVVTTADAGLAVPYELLCLPDGRPLATVPRVSFRRRVRGLAEEPARPTPGPLKILAAVAAPTNTASAPLDVEREMQAIIDVVGPLEQAQAQVRILEVASLGQIERALHRDEYHVLHLSAHGSASTVELEDEDGNVETVDAAQLVGALKRPGRRLPLIVLSSCSGAAGGDTGLAIELLRHGADRVIAMQTRVSDPYATALMARVYALLAERNPPVAVALATARAELHAQAVASGRVDARPEWGVATLLAAGDDPPLVDPARRQDLKNPDVAPAGKEVRELPLGELIGRRDQLRRTLRILRGDPAVADIGANSGVVLTGIGGIGKTAIAGRVIARLRTDTPPWAIVVHVGRWSPASLLSGVAALLPADDEREALLAAPGEQQLAFVQDLLRTQRLLLVFDDFEQNLTVGGGEFLDPGFAEIFGNLCAAAATGRLLVTCRYPLPADLDLVDVPVPPLSRAELGRLLLRLPALANLTGEDRRTIVDTIGGHPRLIEFTDALMRGQGGRGRLASVAKRLRALAGSDIVIARRPEQAPGAAEAARQAVILGTRDILLDALLGQLTASQRAVLLQAAVSRVPFSVADLAFALAGAPVDPSAPERAFKVVNGLPPADVARAVEADADHLIAVTLLTPVDGEVVVHAWVAEALAKHQGDTAADRHLRAHDMRWHRITGRRGGFDDLVEMARHLAAAGRTDDLVDFAFAISNQLPGELAVAAFLGEVLPSVPQEHPRFLPLMGREQQALIATGNRAAALTRAQEQLRVAQVRVDTEPSNVGFQRDLSVSYSKLGDLAQAAGDAAAARDWYMQGLE